MADFYEIDFLKGIVILVKVDEIYNILKYLEYLEISEKFLSTLLPMFLSSCFLFRMHVRGTYFRVWCCNIDDTGAR